MRSMWAVSILGAVMAWAATAWCGESVARAAAASAGSLQVEVEQGDGTVTAGRLERIDADGVRLAVGHDGAGGQLVLPGDRVRAVRRVTETTSLPDARPRLLVTLIDGSMLSGDDFEWGGRDSAILTRPEGRIELPASRVRSLAWSPGGAADDSSAPWQESIPEGTEKDLVVVGTAENHEFVECAIMAVSSDAVTVQLEEETIPVKRSKVIGLRWLRDEAAAPTNVGARVNVSVSGGAVRAARVEWSDEGLVIDGTFRLPAAMLTGIDYAAGRLMPLADIPAEKIDVEPWFGGLLRTGGRNDVFTAYFSPRTIDSTGSAPPLVVGEPEKRGRAVARPASLLMRPRTVAVWRLPPDSRRFRAVVQAAAGPRAADATLISVAVDGREAVRRQVGGGEGDHGAIDIELHSGRRLTVTVDFGPAGGIGGAVLLIDPVIER